jgi:hypothetical protein
VAKRRVGKFPEAFRKMAVERQYQVSADYLIKPPNVSTLRDYPVTLVRTVSTS